jgi:hypothetical protein
MQRAMASYSDGLEPFTLSSADEERSSPESAAAYLKQGAALDRTNAEQAAANRPPPSEVRKFFAEALSTGLMALPAGRGPMVTPRSAPAAPAPKAPAPELSDILGEGGMSRRTFLKGTAATGAVAATGLPGAALEAATAPRAAASVWGPGELMRMHTEAALRTASEDLGAPLASQEVRKAAAAKLQRQVDYWKDYEGVSQYKDNAKMYRDAIDLTDTNFPKTLVEYAPEAVSPRTAETRGEIPQSAASEERLVVARKMPDGTMRYGKPGELHESLLDPSEHNQYAVDDQMGWARPGGRFMTREQAAATVPEDSPAVFDGKLEAKNYFERTPADQADFTAEDWEHMGRSAKRPGPQQYAKVTGPQESHPDYVYHATNAERAGEIAESGKLGRHRPGDFTEQETWPDGTTAKRNYFTPTAENTWQFAPEEGHPTLLRIKRDAHPFKKESTGDLYSNKDVPASQIEVLTENGWEPLSAERSAKGDKKDVTMFEVPSRAPRDFRADYPEGAPHDESGVLTHDLEGRPLVARYVAGRNMVNEPDQPVAAHSLPHIVQRSTGKPVQFVPSHKLDGDLGVTRFNKESLRPTEVGVSNDLKPDMVRHVLGHEVGHVVDQLAKEIPIKGIEPELYRLYNSLNNPIRTRGGNDALPWARRITPKTHGYTEDAIPRELMAEATRAYLFNPNFIKTVAPKVAARIRAYVNENPWLKRTIQFNSLAGLGVIATEHDQQ